MKVSVVLPAYNAVATLPRALDSLRQQNFPDMEIIVVNDGSTDDTREFLRQQTDIRLLDRPHRGIVAALNDGLSAATGEYIARMDADDICHPNRIRKQIEFLDSSPHIDLVGCRVAFGGDREKQAGYAAYVDWINTLITPEEIALNRFIESPFAHPSVLFRRKLVDQLGGYRDGSFPEDYELWLRWMAAGVHMGKVDEELLRWNDPPNRLSRTDERYSTAAFYQTKAAYLVQWLEKNNPHHPNLLLWGAGRTTRKRAEIFVQLGIRITHYIDIKPRQLPCGTPVLLPHELPDPATAFILPMVGKRGARNLIQSHLKTHGFTLGKNYIFAA